MKNIPTIHNDGTVTQEDKPEEVSIVGTSLMGHVDVAYSLVVRAFGEPDDEDSEKVDASWLIMTPDGVASVYNYKDGKNYLGADGAETEDITDWHIGGKSKDVVPHVVAAIEKAKKGGPKAAEIAEHTSHAEVEVVAAYLELGITASDDAEDIAAEIDEAYVGEFSSDEEFAMDMAEQLGSINKDATWPNSYIDWERAAHDLMMDYSEDAGHYFRNI